MNPSLLCNTCKNAIDQASTGATLKATQSHSKPEPVIVSDHVARIARPNDQPALPSVDNDAQNPCPNSGLSAPTKKRNFCARRKTSVINKKRSIVLRPLMNTRKITKLRSQTCNNNNNHNNDNDDKTKKKTTPSSDVAERTDNSGGKLQDPVNRETSPKLRQVCR